ncbi:MULTISPECIES: SGNH/GDSL hydrolase family protein [Acinetobacter]|uniref:SGNH/GDSL hydrolase family protein n=2 Tax=Acinetobacter variabilis TaxID=70346 RepID=A0A7T7WFQ8_9GAMM|nr:MULTISPECIES: SGNH/GDSL hydrolase family protein [Acinetobacter]NHB64571.1 SGNH/GDSL hydrolase family protein [Acinetobacter sp. GFQ9D191M]NHC01066.1 SGNH/GDSL hydrolase family protein [Acinetobacter sp. GFQ9D192M]QQN86898.1 SGNH/GDSL hydrolase family protein [Acinetobacter variabilis]WKT74570.1 SGNH/GDSL hydrolase family protein [Acinetobacter variabilis]
MLLKAATIALIPALVIQGNRVKKNTIKLPEPEGAREGQTGTGKKLSLLIVGDSAAAGVGVDHQNDALLGAILNELKNDFEIEWKLQAKTGDTTSKVIRTLDQIEAKSYDVVVTSVGVNDVTKLMPADVWIKKQEQFYGKIQQKFNPKLVIAAGVPPMNMFPALPNPLAWLFGQYAKHMNQQLEKFVNKQINMQWIEYDIEKYRAMNLQMAKDGFHPSKEVYTLWGQEVASKIRQAF